MAKTNEIHVRVKRLKHHPVCVTLHNGETYVGYISGVNSEGVVLTGGGKLTQAAITAPSSGGGTHKTKPKAGATRKTVSSRNRKRANSIRKSQVRSRSMSRSTSRPAQVSSFMPMLGSLLGGFGGVGGAGSIGGMLGGGMRLFGMIQRFTPVVKMGYGMIKQIQPFMGAVQGLMAPQSQAAQAETEDEEEAQQG
ncbi:hypothetical protein BK131_08805 [Paenibacillus amylolyticus]|uniref:Uncharacterized protein n=1 Tax=Paenibacillus amylolyticus TaxID=1451 RepID=A0A1R1C7A6_PAEAM|nr:hypothetical protein [Paenibacillus amylolyticus]OMF18022.1 hypothetical protein BK131_08805 [Paenibacillus amylolyticus]